MYIHVCLYAYAYGEEDDVLKMWAWRSNSQGDLDQRNALICNATCLTEQLVPSLAVSALAVGFKWSFSDA